MKVVGIIFGIVMILAGIQIGVRGWSHFGQATDIVISYGAGKYLVGIVFFLYGLYMVYSSLKKK